MSASTEFIEINISAYSIDSKSISTNYRKKTNLSVGGRLKTNEQKMNVEMRMSKRYFGRKIPS